MTSYTTPRAREALCTPSLAPRSIMSSLWLVWTKDVFEFASSTEQTFCRTCCPYISVFITGHFFGMLCATFINGTPSHSSKQARNTTNHSSKLLPYLLTIWFCGAKQRRRILVQLPHPLLPHTDSGPDFRGCHHLGLRRIPEYYTR